MQNPPLFSKYLANPSIILTNNSFHFCSSLHFEILINNSYQPYIQLPNDTKYELLNYYIKNYDNYISKNILPLRPVGDAKFHWFSVSGECSHKDINKHRQTYVPKLNGIHIVGSPKCSYTRKAHDLLTKTNIPFTFNYQIEISDALKISGTRTIPAIYINGNYIGGYDELLQMR